MDVTKLKGTVLRTYMPLVDVEDHEELIEIHYRLDALGAKFDEWMFGSEAPTVHEAVARACSYIDLTIDGEPVPCSAEALAASGVPAKFFYAVLAHVRAEGRGGKLGAPSLRNGSLLVAS